MSEQDRQEIEELIPWHAAGTLSPRDAKRVEAAIAADSDLARSYMEALEELAGDVELNEEIPVPSGRIMSNLMARLEVEPKRSPPVWQVLSARIGAVFEQMSPRVLAWSAAAAALVIAVEGGVIGTGAMKHAPQQPAVYQTASGPGPAAVALPGAILLVRFHDEATAADITSLLQAQGATIVSGPSGGLYKVRVSDKALPLDRLDALAHQLQQDKAVAFAAPSP